MNRPGVVWRHDVDYDPVCALKMAEEEAVHGITATYYVLPRSEDYNAFAPRAAGCFHAILDLGHRIGVHVDLHAARDAKFTDMQLHEACARDWKLLRSGFPCRFDVSFHQPPHDVLWRDIPGFEHAMSPGWDGLYVSDSRGVYRHGTPESLLATQGPVQINLHPEWHYLPAAEALALRKQEALKP